MIEQKEWITIHRLTQTITRDRCQKIETKRIIDVCIKALNAHFFHMQETKEMREAKEAFILYAKILFTYGEEQKICNEQLA